MGAAAEETEARRAAGDAAGTAGTCSPRPGGGRVCSLSTGCSFPCSPVRLTLHCPPRCGVLTPVSRKGRDARVVAASLPPSLSPSSLLGEAGTPHPLGTENSPRAENSSRSLGRAAVQRDTCLFVVFSLRIKLHPLLSLSGSS